jgi:hypothetical protein
MKSLESDGFGAKDGVAGGGVDAVGLWVDGGGVVGGGSGAVLRGLGAGLLAKTIRWWGGARKKS